jgi:hypothetical protein
MLSQVFRKPKGKPSIAKAQQNVGASKGKREEILNQSFTS